ncbi:MAG: RluA family pseudouridine synthase [Tepidisphaeraceae bacterium]
MREKPPHAAPATTLHARLRVLYPTAKNQTLKEMVSAGRVRVNGKRAAKLSQPLNDNDDVRVDEKPRARAARKPSLAPLLLVHEDDDVLVVNKPPGLLTSTVPREKRLTALAIVRQYVEATAPNARVGLIHRLDRDAGGLLVFSKSDRAYRSLKTQFFKHTVDREYEAVVKGSPSPKKGRIESRLVEWGDGSVHSTKEHGKGERAVSEYEVIDVKNGLATLRVTLRTGRKHQIRVHLSERGWPIVGDVVYGAGEAGGLKLRAVRLAFDHPDTARRVAFDVRVPD